MALAITATGTVSALPVAPYEINEQGQTTAENSIPRGAFDARAGVASSLYAYPELNQFIAILADAYDESPMTIITHVHSMCASLMRDRNTGEG